MCKYVLRHYSSLLVFMVIVSFYTTERFGRRPLILTGGAGCFICNIIIGSLGTRQKTDAVLNATLGVICIWVVIYAGCLAGVGWGLTTEIATARLRARTAGVVINGSQCFSILFGYVVRPKEHSTSKGLFANVTDRFPSCWEAWATAREIGVPRLCSSSPLLARWPR